MSPIMKRMLIITVAMRDLSCLHPSLSIIIKFSHNFDNNNAFFAGCTFRNSLFLC
jgi:hypothetical protein